MGTHPIRRPCTLQLPEHFIQALPNGCCVIPRGLLRLRLWGRA